MNKKILSILMIAAMAIAQAPGSRVHLTAGFMNKAKDWALPTLIPGNSYHVDLPDQDASGFHLSEMNGTLDIPNESVNFSITENNFETSIIDMHLSFHVYAQYNRLIKGSASPSGSFSTDINVAFGVNDNGQLQVASFGINNFRIGHTNVDLPGFMKAIINFFIDILSNMVQRKLNEVAPGIQGQVNQMLARTPTEVPFGNLPINLDLTFNQAIVLTSGQMIVSNNLFAYNNQKPKCRPPFENINGFPEGPASQDFTFFLSEYTLNSIAFAAFDAGMMAKQIPLSTFTEKLTSLENLNSMFEGLSSYISECQIVLNVSAPRTPSFLIANGVISIDTAFAAEMVASYPDGRVIPILGLNIATNIGASASVVNNSFLQFSLDHVQLTNLEVSLSTFANINISQVTELANAAFAYFLPEMNEKYCNGQIPMNSANYILQGATLELVDRHIMVQATPMFGNFA